MTGNRRERQGRRRNKEGGGKGERGKTPTWDREQDVIPQPVSIQLPQQSKIPIHDSLDRGGDAVPEGLADVVDTAPHSDQDVRRRRSRAPRRRPAGEVRAEQRLDLVVEVILRVRVDYLFVRRRARDGEVVRQHERRVPPRDGLAHPVQPPGRRLPRERRVADRVGGRRRRAAHPRVGRRVGVSAAGKRSAGTSVFFFFQKEPRKKKKKPPLCFDPTPTLTKLSST